MVKRRVVLVMLFPFSGLGDIAAPSLWLVTPKG